MFLAKQTSKRAYNTPKNMGIVVLLTITRCCEFYNKWLLLVIQYSSWLMNNVLTE